MRTEQLHWELSLGRALTVGVTERGGAVSPPPLTPSTWAIIGFPARAPVLKAAGDHACRGGQPLPLSAQRERRF